MSGFNLIEGDVVLRDSSGVEKGTSGNPVKTDPTGTTTQPVSVASLPLPSGAATEASLVLRATETTLAAVQSLLTAIRDTAGIKKITDALPAGTNNIGDVDVISLPSIPAGTNRLGSVRIVDANDARMDFEPMVSIPASSRGFLALGQDENGLAQALDVREDSIDLIRRVQIEGRVSISAPVPPPSTTPVSITFSGALSITSNQTDNYVIANGKNFVVQQIVAGCEGDTSERGSAVEVFYFDGTTAHLIERVYLNGFTTEVYPNTEKARNGTVTLGNGTTKTIRVVRRRLSGSSQEVDFVVRGYEYTP